MRFFTAVIVIAIGNFNSLNAQLPVLYGSTDRTISRYSVGNDQLETVYRFKNSGIFSQSNMVAGRDGIIYGVAQGGPFGYGIIYSLNPATNKYTIRKNFKEVDGRFPNTSLVEGKDGKLYGTTIYGGHNGNGTLFSFDPVSSAFRVLLHFQDVKASFPGTLTMASDGLLYGLVGSGDLFSFDPISKEFKVQNFISGYNAYFPSRPMVEVAGGMLYGLMEFGGANRSGILYSYSLSSKQITKLVDFNSETGTNPNGNLTLGSDGKLYSTTSSGGTNELYGTVFCFDPKDNSVKVIFEFDGKNGSGRGGSFAEGDDGKFYGMSLKRVNDDYLNFVGSVFYSIDKEGNNYKVIRDFNHLSGNVELPEGRLTEVNMILVNHKLYGIALAERTNPYEYIFSYESSQDRFQKIIRTNLDKGRGLSTLMQARDGRFYGTAAYGGGFGRGGIFSLNPGTEKYTMLYSFHSIEREGTNAEALVQAGNGKLYGLTAFDGLGNRAVVFSYDPEKSRYVVEKSLDHNLWPTVPFAPGKDGILYSVVNNDASGENYIFSFNPNTREYKQLTKLCCGDMYIGFTPSADGKLYAFRSGIVSYDPATNLVELIPFSAQDHTVSNNVNLVEGSDHKLYGIMKTQLDQNGFIFSFDPSDRSFTKLFSFDNQPGYDPMTGLVYASDGKLYGTTRNGGMYNNGVLFSFDQSTRSFNVLRHLDEHLSVFSELNMRTQPLVSITDEKLYEGEVAKITVSLNRISTQEIALTYRTVAGTASDAGEHPDFIPASGQIIIPAGEISTSISVKLLKDELTELREEFAILLQRGNEAQFQLGDSIGRIQVMNGIRPIIPPGGEIITIPKIPNAAAESIVKNELTIRASPNPTSSFFSLYISSAGTDRVSVTVTNLSGHVLDKFDGALKGALTFGHNYKSGSYFVRVMDRQQHRVIKLVKTSK